jgi:alkylhydroperoxidase family enzyme
LFLFFEIRANFYLSTVPEKEVVALNWCESITRGFFEKIDEIKDEMLKHFSEREVVDITSCISIMNALNRIAISLRTL